MVGIVPRYEYRAWLTDRGDNNPIYDGDTVWLTVDLGFNHFWDMGPCRLTGINAPEMRGENKAAGTLSRDYVRGLLSRPENKVFLIRTEKDTTEKYGRYLVTIILPDGTILNEDLVDKGYAVYEKY